MSNIDELKAELENAAIAYAAAVHQDENEDSTTPICVGWVAVVELTSEQLEQDNQWSLIKAHPATQLITHTTGMLQWALDDITHGGSRE